MSNNITSFIGGFGGGYRPNRFRVSGKLGTTGKTVTNFHIKAANLPASSLTTISVPYRGRMFKMPGNRTYTPWQITVLDDTVKESGTALWGHFHTWSNKINDHLNNNTPAGTKLDFTGEMETWDVYQLDINGNDTKQIKLYYCWPADVGPITLNMDDNETLSTFTVTLEYSYYSIADSDT